MSDLNAAMSTLGDLDINNELRPDRNELPDHDLSEFELKERAFRLDLYQKWKEATPFPASACDRQKALLLEWATHDNYRAGCILTEKNPNWETDETSFYVSNEAWKSLHSLIDHAKYCPQCVVFPVPVPYFKATT